MARVKTRIMRADGNGALSIETSIPDTVESGWV
jgi:hypothetical protein